MRSSIIGIRNFCPLRWLRCCISITTHLYLVWHCCTRIAESHQTPQEPWIDAETVRNFITSSTGTLFTQCQRSPLWKRQIIFILYSRGSGKGSLRGLVNSSTKGVVFATDWWVRVRGVRDFPVLPWLARWVSFSLNFVFSPLEGVLLKMAVLSTNGVIWVSHFTTYHEVPTTF